MATLIKASKIKDCKQTKQREKERQKDREKKTKPIYGIKYFNEITHKKSNDKFGNEIERR
jgi:hypothetical protein